MAVITVEGVEKSFGPVKVIRDFSASVADKEFVTLLGPSGCGKTTMLRMLAGFERPDAGEIRIDGRLVSSPAAFVPPEERGIGMVFQSYAVWPHMTVFDNIAYPLKIAGTPKPLLRQKADAILEAMRLTPYACRSPAQLSGGQQQRVALGRALVREPRLLLLDEPLSNLDAKLRESMRFEIKEIQKRFGITVVYVTHDQSEAMAMSDRIMVMYRGALQQAAPPAEIYRRPANPFVADFTGKVNFIPGEAADGAVTAAGFPLPYSGPLRGAVTVAVRPENISLIGDLDDPPINLDVPPAVSASGGAFLEGVITGLFYLGDVTDCRVSLCGAPAAPVLRVTASSASYNTLKEGQRACLRFNEFMVYAAG